MRKIDLTKMSYEELKELEKEIKKQKPLAKNYLTKGNFDLPYRRALTMLFHNRGLNSNKLIKYYITQIEQSVFKIADLTMGNYAQVPDHRGLDKNSLRRNGSVITSDDNDKYAEMVREINFIITKYADSLPGSEEEESK